MTAFVYQGRDKAGALVKGELDATSMNSVAKKLNDLGVIPTSIEKSKSIHGIEEQIKEFLQEDTLGLEELSNFCRQMFSLTKAGVPIVKAMRSLSESTRNLVLARVLREVSVSLESGKNLASALDDHQKYFSKLFISMVHIGENTGRLDLIFKELARHFDLERETRKRLKQATRYPMFVVGALILAIVILNIFVIPTFAGIFEKFGADLPIYTRILITTSDFMINYWMLISLVIFVFGFFFYQFVNTESGQIAWDKKKLSLPFIGSIIERIILARFCRSFSMMLAAGVPLLQALVIISRSLGNEYVGSQVRVMRIGVERGDSLTNTAAATNLFPPLVLQMISVGEETGSVDNMLLECAEFYENEIDYDLKRMSDAIEPVIMVAMGGIVLVLALGIFLPMWDLGKAAMH